MPDVLVMFIKIVLTVLLFPVVHAIVLNFQDHVAGYPIASNEFFMWGVFGFVLVFLFIHQFRRVYMWGQSIMMGIFRFLMPLDRPIARVIPFYMTLIVGAYCTANKFLDAKTYEPYFIFFAGFAFAMHIIVLAQDLQEEEESFFRPSYFFKMSLYFIISVCVVVLFLDLAAWKFTFFKFVSSVFGDARDTYVVAMRKIF